MAHTVIPPPRCTDATLELTHKGNVNDKTIMERDREVKDLNVTLLASAIARHQTDKRGSFLDFSSSAIDVLEKVLSQ